jgi:hypothetical protein
MEMFTTPRVLLLVLAIGQLALPPLLFANGFATDAQKPPLPFEPNPATPAGYAFAIWGVIYVGALISAIYQLLPTAPQGPAMEGVRWLCIIGYACCIGWLVAARFGPGWATVLLIWIMLLTIGSAFVLAARHWSASGDELNRWPGLLIGAPLAVYAGWLTAAAFINAADVLPGYGFSRFGMSAQSFGVLIIGCAGLLSFGFLWAAGPQPVYIVTVIWALVGIIARNGTPSLDRPVSTAAATAAVLLIVAAAIATSLPPRGAS